MSKLFPKMSKILKSQSILYFFWSNSHFGVLATKVSIFWGPNFCFVLFGQSLFFSKLLFQNFLIIFQSSKSFRLFDIFFNFKFSITHSFTRFLWVFLVFRGHVFGVRQCNACFGIFVKQPAINCFWKIWVVLKDL